MSNNRIGSKAVIGWRSAKQTACQRCKRIVLTSSLIQRISAWNVEPGGIVQGGIKLVCKDV